MEKQEKKDNLDNSVLCDLNNKTEASGLPSPTTERYSLPKRVLKDLPYRIPGGWVTPEQAKSLNYKKVDNIDQSWTKVAINQSMVAFSASNIGYI